MCLCLLKSFMSNIRHVTPFADPYFVKTLFTLPVSFGPSLFSTSSLAATESLFLASWIFQWPFQESSLAICTFWVESSSPTIAGEAGLWVWTGPRMFSMLLFSIFLLSILWTFFFITNTLFLYPEIMTTLDSIFSSLQRGSGKQAARLCHDQLKQLILWRQEPNYSL